MAQNTTKATKTPTPPKAPDAFGALKAGLLALAATKQGFEKVAAAVVDTLSGGAVRLMASGDQFGLDAVTDPTNGLRRAMQAKRYKDTTPLNTTHLAGEMLRASQQFEAVDTWVLVTTQTLEGKERELLDRGAQGLGWSFLSLDWTPMAGVPLLAAACARAETEIAPLLEPAARDELAMLAASGRWQPAADHLTRTLTDVTAGFGQTRDGALAVIHGFGADAASARAHAGPSARFLAEAPPVPREQLRSQLQAWWSGESRLAALVGDEGAGKTWAALDALTTLANDAGAPLPVIVPSRDATRSADGLEAVVTALCAMGDEAGRSLADPPRYWRRKLRLWSTGAPAPTILVLLDGLDEAAQIGWGDYVAPLLEARWNGLFRVLMTSRPDTWRRLPSLAETAEELTVGRFAPAERDAFLRSRGVNVGELSKEVLDAALHPRTAFHLTRLADELPDLKRVTREQLLLLDYQNRCLVKDGRTLDDAEFSALVRKLATEARAAALRQEKYSVTAGGIEREAAELAGFGRGDFSSVLSELVAGRWCERDPADQTRIRFQANALPAAVGLALAHAVRSQSPEVAIAELDRFLEPWGADDLAEKVLRMCAVVLVTDGTAPDELVFEVVARWRDAPLRGEAGADVWRRLQVFRPDLFLDLCARLGGRSHDWLPEWGIASLWEDYPAIRPKIEARLLDWVMTIYLLRFREGDTPANTRILNTARRRQSRRMALLRRSSAAPWDRWIGTERPGFDDQQALALRIISLLPRAPFLLHLVGWALSAAAADRHERQALVNWILRENLHDVGAANSAVRGAADALVQLGDPVSRVAAQRLLDATGEPEDAQRAAALANLKPIGHPMGPAYIADGAVEPQLELSPPARRSASYTLAVLSPHIGDPALRLAPDLEAHLRETLRGIELDEALRILSHTGLALDPAVMWFPEEVAKAMSWFAAEGDPELAVKTAADNLPLLGTADRQALCARYRGAGPAHAERLRSQQEGDAALTALSLADAPLDQQFDVLHRTPSWPRGYDALLQAAGLEAISAELGRIDLAAEPHDLGRQLDLVCQLMRHAPNAHDYASMKSSIDWGVAWRLTDPALRLRLLEIAGILKSQAAARALDATGWTSHGIRGQAERFLGSQVLVLIAPGDAARIMPRLDLEILADTIVRMPALREQASVEWLRQLEAELTNTRKTRSFGGEHWFIKASKAIYDELAAANGAALIALFERVWADKSLRNNVVFDLAWEPVWHVLQALAPHAPELVKGIWRHTSGGDRGISSSSLDAVPCELPVGPLFDDLRAEMLARARQDDELFAMACGLQRNGHSAFLRAVIVADLASSAPVFRARGVTLAGFLDSDAEAKALWAQALPQPPEGWLGQVYEAARIWWSRGVQMRHWGERAIQESSETGAFVAHRMFRAVADERYRIWWREPYGDEAPPWRQQWWNYLSGQRLAPSKERRDALKKTRFHTPTAEEVFQHSDLPVRQA